jgi:hypothetical protein
MLVFGKYNEGKHLQLNTVDYSVIRLFISYLIPFLLNFGIK